ncbi:MAG: PP2C family protein-serine/threonine phosphatase [Lachnospiraceae bacterium]|nr:PP2C family protein-serine/threonine phosphatase [Lachnospiraceae bacterium]
MEKKTHYRPLGRTILIGTAIFSIVLCLIQGTYGGIQYYNGMMSRYETYMESALRYSLAQIDGDDLEQCISTGEKSEKYNELQATLDQIKETHQIDYIYIVKPLNTEVNDNMMNVIAGTTQYEYEYESEYLSELGELTADAYTPEVAGKYLESFGRQGDEITYFMDETEYGHDYTGLINVRNSAGSPVAILAVDISVEEIWKVLTTYALSTLIGIIILVALFLTFMYRWLKKRVVTPISQIQIATEEFVQSSHGEDDPDKIIYNDPKIQSGDEIQSLSEAIVTMTDDLKAYMKSLIKETKEKERIGAELNVATQIQASMLPCIFPPFPEREEIDIYATMNPAKEVGGDFYDFFWVDKTHIAIVMADVSGKGVPAALFMVIAKTLIKDHTQVGKEPGQVFTDVNQLLCESNSGELFVTAFEAVLDLETGEMVFVNAGHETPFICKKNGKFEPYKIRAAFVLAGMEGMKYRAGSIQLEPGDKIFQYTDGVTEATNAHNELYGMDRLGKALADNSEKKSIDIVQAVKKDVDEFVGDAPQFDDITMLCMEFVRFYEQK